MSHSIRLLGPWKVRFWPLGESLAEPAIESMIRLPFKSGDLNHLASQAAAESFPGTSFSIHFLRGFNWPHEMEEPVEIHIDSTVPTRLLYLNDVDVKFQNDRSENISSLLRIRNELKLVFPFSIETTVQINNVQLVIQSDTRS